MRCSHGFRIACCFTFVLCLFAGAAVGAASTVETTPLSTETVVLPSEETVEVTDPVPTEVDSLSDSPVVLSPETNFEETLAPDSERIVSLPIPARCRNLSGFLIRCELGGILARFHLYVPVGYSSDTIRFDNGMLYNMSDSTVYLYSNEFPDYVFYASRFSPVGYRVSNSGTFVTLTDVELIQSYTGGESSWSYVYFFLLLVIVFLLIRGGFKL